MRKVYLVEAYRAGLASGYDAEFPVEIVVGVKFSEYGASMEVIKGNITGFESFYLDQFFNDLEKGTIPEKGLYWCAGTDGRWDSLRTPKEELIVLLEAIRNDFPCLTLPQKQQN